MNKALRLVITLGTGLAVTAAAVLLFALRPSVGEGNVPAQDATLVNGGFEGTYEAWEEEDARKIAPSWSLWYTTAWPSEQFITLPHANEESRPEFVRDGKAQALHSDGDRNFDACLYQQISGITVGHYIRFSAWAKVDAHGWFDSPDKIQTRVGIDPAGGTNPMDINYYENLSLWDTYTDKGQWQHLSVVMKVASPTATVYACAHPSLAKWFHAYWDDATFTMTPESLVYVPMVSKKHCWIAPSTLANPDLEEDYCAIEGYQVHPGFPNIFVAPFWHPFWNTNFDPETGENRQPEYGDTDRSYRVKSGRVSQQTGISGGGTFEAGIYQVVQGTNVSDTLRFTIWGLGWNQHWPKNDPDGTNEFVSDYTQPGGLRFRVGIDPYGEESYTSTNIVWSEFYDPYDAWHHLEITATALSDKVSVWAYAHPLAHWMRWNESFWDNASLEVIESP